MIRIGRTLPPAAAPICFRDVLSGLGGSFRGQWELNRFESEIKGYFHVRHCFLVSTGKAALTLILVALKDLHPDRGEVLIPAFTCYSVPSAIGRAGLIIRLCDMDPDSLDFDFNQLRRILSEYTAVDGSRAPIPVSHAESRRQTSNGSGRLLAIIPTHLFGLAADVGQMRTLVEDPEVTVIEDAAQAMGGEWKGKKLGTFGDVGFLSLGRGKPLCTVEGGIILTNRDDIADKIRNRLEVISGYATGELVSLFLRAVCLSLFLRPSAFWLPKSIPFLKLGTTVYDPNFKIRKMSTFQAGLGRAWQKKIREFAEIRTKNSMEWASITRRNNLNHYLSRNGGQPSLIRFPVRIGDDKSRAGILAESARMGLGIMSTYPSSVDGIGELRHDFRGQDFPKAKKLAKSLVTLPTHSFVNQNDKHQIAALISRLHQQDG